jgi:Spy/CpxP family protein refolding chaperone
MKTLITVTLSLLLAATSAWAERPEGGQGQRGDRMARMQKHLDLSDDQVSQMKEIRANGGNREDMRSVLNDDQRQQMQEYRKNHKGKGGNRQRPPQEEDEA